MKCLNCNNEAVGRSKYCGDKCKVAWNRNRKRNIEALIESVTLKSVTMPETVTTAPTTQEQDEYKAAQSTKSDGPGQYIGVARYAAESQPSPRIAFGIDQPTKADEVMQKIAALDPSALGKVIGLPGDDDYNGCVSNPTIKTGDWCQVQGVASADLPPQPATAAPVDESMSKA